ncbi:plectin-like [Amphibalanus amphitrite]|uniref:plectin-like n=1 Tax=Amphibalanus amphitrite TaxID=1232801 RepID=UPI001C900B7E|nr:plectin-like [Amphibalanus amphitrite]XP_043224414.1 plectin-like [Amphibalanus amphitrite]
MAEVAASRPPAGLSLSAENLHALDPAPLDDLVESEVIVGDDSDDEFAFNGEVKDAEEIYIQNGPRGPSMTVGHLTIEHSYCTPEPDDEPAVKLVDPDRFSDFFLMEESAGGAGHLQLFSDMRQCVAGSALSYMQVTGAAVLSSLQQAGRRLESLTEEDESEAAQEPPARAVSLPAPVSAAALSPPTGRAAAAAPPVPADAASGADMAATTRDRAPAGDVWGGGVGRAALDGDAEPTPAVDSGNVTEVGPTVDGGGVDKSESSASSGVEAGSQEKQVQPADDKRSENSAAATAVSKPSESSQSDGTPPVDTTDSTQPQNAGSPSDLTQSVTANSSVDSARPVTDTASPTEPTEPTGSSGGEITQSATLSSIADMTQSMTVPSPPARSSPPALMTQSLGPVSFSDPFHVLEQPAEAAEDPPEAVSLVSPVEPATAISGPVSLVGIVLPTAAAAPPADAPADGTLWESAAPAAPSVDNNAAGALPVLKIDESVELKGEGERDATTSSSDRSTPPRTGGRTASTRPGAARASPRSSLTARAQQDLAKARSSSTTREEKRALSSYGTLPRRGKKSPPSSEAGKKEELPAVSEITRKQPAPGTRPTVKPAACAAPLRRRPMDKKISELKKSESAPSSGSDQSRSRKPSAEAELKSSADKYGTLTRRKEPKSAAADSASAKTTTFTAEELKRGADTFGTLGRRKKAPAAAKPAAAPARSEAAAKPAAPAVASSSRPASASTKTTSPRPATSASAAARRPAAAARPLARPAGRTTAAASAGKVRERTLICLETGCQTVLTGGDLSAAASLRPQPAVTCLEAACQAEIASPQAAQQAAELARLQAEAERARQAQEQLKQIQEELWAARRQLEEEQADKQEVQTELGRTTDRVQHMMGRMEGVEQELLRHQEHLQSAELRAQHADSAAEALQHELELSRAAVARLSEDLEKSVAAQKTLLQQVQETEAESCELHEFMQLEKNALVDALREAENEVASMRTASAAAEDALREKEDRCAQLTRISDQRAEEMAALKADLRHVQNRTKELLLCQGAGVSGASVALSQLAGRLETALRSLVPAHLLADLDLPLSSSVPARLAETVTAPRRSASVAAALAGPPRSLSQMVRALDLPAGETLADERCPLSGGDSLQELAVRHLLEGRDSPEGEESCSERGEAAVGGGSGLEEQVTQVDLLVERLIRAAATLGQKAVAQTPSPAAPVPAQAATQTPTPATDRPAPTSGDSERELRDRLARLEAENAELRRRQAPPPPGAGSETETTSLRQELSRKERQLDELKQKYTKHKQILTENVQKAESEIQTLDEIIDYVIVSLGSVPEVVQKQSVLRKLWMDLDGPNKTVAKTKLNGTTPISDLNANADIVKV